MQTRSNSLGKFGRNLWDANTQQQFGEMKGP